MGNNWFDVQAVRGRLAQFFEQNKERISLFGSRVNQVFEAFVFAQVVGWYKERDWLVKLHNPPTKEGKTDVLRLKFSTRGRASNYSFACCSKGTLEVHVRHQLRVATYSFTKGEYPPANICLDIAVIRAVDVSELSSDDWIPNDELVTFGEAKHFSAFAELIAGFIGLVHELQPGRLQAIRVGEESQLDSEHLAPFLYVSGLLWKTAEGIRKTIVQRGYDLDIYTRTEQLSGAVSLHVLPIPSHE